MCKLCDAYDFRGIGYDFPACFYGAAANLYFSKKGEIVPPEEHFKYCPVCGKPLTEEHFKPALFLRYKGRDSWDRPVYESDGCLYVDTDPREGREPRIATKYRNAFDGEPDNPVKGRFVFVPRRHTWH